VTVPPTYERTPSDGYRALDRWDDGVGWVAHPGGSGVRTSHAIRADDGIWLFDSLDARGVDDLVADRVDAPVERVDDSVAGFDLRPVRPLYAWHECIAYRERDRTLYVPDYLSSHAKFTVRDERVGLPSLSRLDPPRATFADCEPARIFFGHGTGVFEAATAALWDCLDGARVRFPRALACTLPAELRVMLPAVWD
jgi:hypothetical protein